MSSNPGGISQSNSGYMFGGMQAAFGNNNVQTLSSGVDVVSDIPAQAELVQVLEQVDKIIRNSELSEVVKAKAIKYIETAKIEAEEEEPDKQLISKNIERVAKNLEEVDKTVDAGKRIFEKIIPLLKRIVSLLGAAAGSLGGFLP